MQRQRTSLPLAIFCCIAKRNAPVPLLRYAAGIFSAREQVNIYRHRFAVSPAAHALRNCCRRRSTCNYALARKVLLCRTSMPVSAAICASVVCAACCRHLPPCIYRLRLRESPGDAPSPCLRQAPRCCSILPSARISSGAGGAWRRNISTFSGACSSCFFSVPACLWARYLASRP